MAIDVPRGRAPEPATTINHEPRMANSRTTSLPLVVRLDAEGNQALPNQLLGFAVYRVPCFRKLIPHVLEHQDQLLGADLPVAGFDHELPQHPPQLRVRDVRVRDVVRENGPESRDRGTAESASSGSALPGPFI